MSIGTTNSGSIGEEAQEGVDVQYEVYEVIRTRIKLRHYDLLLVFDVDEATQLRNALTAALRRRRKHVRDSE